MLQNPLHTKFVANTSAYYLLFSLMSRFMIATLCGVLLSSALWAQNIFHDRAFWAKKPSVETVKEKIAEGHDILEMGPGGWDGPLLAIMADCDYATIKYILELPGINVNVITHHSNNYLMWTTQKGNIPVMKLLLTMGSKTDIINSHGQSLLMHAALSGKADRELYELCLQNGGDIVNDKDELGRNVMLTAIGGLTDLSFLEFFKSKGLTLNDTDNDGNGLFHYAVASGNIQKIKSLVEMEVPYTPNKLGENAFAFVGRGRGARLSVELLAYLKGLGLDPKTPFANGQTLPHTAARMGADAAILRFLEENNLPLNTPDKEGNTPLILASARADLGFVSYWLGYNTLNATNTKGQSALTQAVATSSPEVVKLLLDKGANSSQKTVEGHDLYTVLLDAYRKEKGSVQRAEEIIALLVASGLPKPAPGVLLHKAFEKGDKELIEKLLQLGEDINAKDKDGYTLLHYASMKSKDLEMMKYLVAKGANPGIKTELDETVLDLISENEVLSQQPLNLDFLKK